MKKFILSFAALWLSVFAVYAKPVTPAFAKEIAASFYETSANAKSKAKVEFNLVYTSVSTAQGMKATGTPLAYFYAFNSSDAQSFILVSADDATKPILGYSYEGAFNPDNIPSSTQKWLEWYKTQIRYVIEHHIEATTEIKREWDNLTYSRPMKRTTGSSVNPLVVTKWNQLPYYNDLCPYDYDKGKKSVTGCVATAMAQVLKYWDYPKQGSGFHSYNHPKYGTLSANFGNTTFNWSNMPAKISSKNNDIANLMYSCGVSVDMNYSPESSGAWVLAKDNSVSAEAALKIYFGYASTLKGIERNNYTESNWISTLKIELDNSQPVIYDGFGSGGGHCFVCDGYDVNDYFHFNWGWGGAYDGYFEVGALNPDGLGTGGGTGSYNSGQQAIIGIKPANNNGGGGGGSSASMKLYDYVASNYNPIYYDQAFTIHTDLINSSSSTFSGKYCAALFDKDLNFVGYIGDSLQETGLPANYHYKDGIDFKSTGMLSAVPGTYYVGIYYKSGSGNWVAVADNGSYTNFIMLEVINPNDIALYSDMSVGNGGKITNGNSLTVHLDVGNYGSTNFNGTLDLSLYNLDGSYAFSIETKDNMSIAAGYHFTNGLDFKTSKVNVAPGTYLLALLHKHSGGNWQITGSTYHTNPIKVIVQEAPLPADPYEDNNTLATAYQFIPSFIGSDATVQTAGANIHVESDYDYYKVHFRKGYDYSIYPVLFDQNYSDGSGTKYTEDGLISYSTDGTNWSDAYDDVITQGVELKDGGDIYIIVSPYFQGKMGTYKFSLTATRVQRNTAIRESDDEQLNLYPNPASSVLSLKTGKVLPANTSWRIMDMSGKTLLTDKLRGETEELTVPVDKLSSGMYIIELQTGEGILRKRFTVSR